MRRPIFGSCRRHQVASRTVVCWIRGQRSPRAFRSQGADRGIPSVGIGFLPDWAVRPSGIVRHPFSWSARNLAVRARPWNKSDRGRVESLFPLRTPFAGSRKSHLLRPLRPYRGWARRPENPCSKAWRVAAVTDGIRSVSRPNALCVHGRRPGRGPHTGRAPPTPSPLISLGAGSGIEPNVEQVPARNLLGKLATSRC